MILIKATIKYAGYDPSILTKGSRKRICYSCDDCGRVRWGRKYAIRDLCKSCVKKGNKNGMCDVHRCGKDSPNYGHKHSDETKKRMRNKRLQFYKNNPPKFGSNHPAWKGGDITLICQQCDKNFEVPQCQKNIKFCSNKCKGKWQSENLIGENSPNWKGGIAYNRDHVLLEKNCVKLNQRFENSEGHHLTSGIMVYIPEFIHRSIYHNMKSGQGIDEINKIAWKFLMDGI